MRATAVGHCSHCAAVVNVHWPSCLVCHTILSPPIQYGCKAMTSRPPPQRDDGREVSATIIQAGDRITWQGTDGKANNGVIDFLHTYPGEMWAFCTLPDGEWTAVNAKYIRKVEASL